MMNYPMLPRVGPDGHDKEIVAGMRHFHENQE